MACAFFRPDRAGHPLEGASPDLRSSRRSDQTDPSHRSDRSRSLREQDMSGRIGMGTRNGDLHIAAERVQEPHEAIGGKALQPSAGDRRNFGLVKAEDFRSLGLRKPVRLIARLM